LQVPGIPAARWTISASINTRSRAPTTLDLLAGEEYLIVLKLTP